jgi:type IV pilus assembly protein PilM
LKDITLYIDDVSVRLMLAQGKKIRQWAYSPLEPGLVRNNVVIDKVALAERIKQLLEAHDMKGRRVALALSGLHCLTRPIDFPQLPKAMLDEAVKREARRVLPIPPEQLYISWQTTHEENGRLQVFLVALPCKMADSLVQMLGLAGLKPSHMDIKPLLLARMVRETKAIIVDVQPSDFDIVVTANGVPQPIRTMSFAGEELGQEDKLSVVSSELDRTITFYDSKNAENRLDETVPVYVSGELARRPELWRSLSEQLGRPVRPLSSPFESPPGFDASQYMANLGVTLQSLLDDGMTTPSLVNLNVLPEPYKPRSISLKNILAPPGAVVGASLLTFLIVMTQSVSADISSLDSDLQTKEQLVRQNLVLKEGLTREVGSLKSQIAEAEVARDSFAAVLSSIKEQGSGLNQDLTAVRRLPNKLSLSGILHQDGVLTISGHADSEKTVLSYLQDLNETRRFGEIVVTNMLRTQAADMQFTLAAELKQPSSHISGIEAVLGKLPAGVELTDVSTKEGIFTVYGTSSSEILVLRYLQDLEASGRFGEITISRMMRTQDDGTDFSLILKIRE